uniref:Hexosyltransferase n=1 Tax=Physcomitrium patens TaxID=3218 RepID=A0A7I4ACQ5_PHYPA
MAFRKNPPNLPIRNNARNGGYRASVIALLLLSVLAPLLILTNRTSNFLSSGLSSDQSSVSLRIEEIRRRSALEGIEALFPKEVLDIVNSNSEGTGPLNLNVFGHNYLSSSWVQEEGRLSTLESQSYEDAKIVPESGVKNKLENEGWNREKTGISEEVAKSASTWKRDADIENSDALVRLMRDQLITARVYANIAQSQGHYDLVHDLKLRIKEHSGTVGDANLDAQLPSGAEDKMKLMSELLVEAREKHYDNALMVKKLRAMLQSTEDNARILKKQSTFLSQLAAKTVPKGLHCFSMRLAVEYHMLPPAKKTFQRTVAVVVNSTIQNAKEPEKHVFHIVTDKLNFGAMMMWFLANPPGAAVIQVQNVDDFKWLNASYSPVLKQLKSTSMKDYYFKADQTNLLAAGTSNLKYRNPKYLSMLNHLRFYLPEVFPKLNKILFLDDDIVVQRDLTPLWHTDLNGNVNGAVETCGASFHRFDKYLNFSNPLISTNFHPNACGWAYGMNVFDLKEWKKLDITGIYHRWQSLNEHRSLWKLGTLPPGLITFYNLTQPLEKSWHVLGLGYNPAVEESEIEAAAVIHWNGNMKPWLEIGMAKYKPYWTKFVNYNHPYLQQCNVIN